MYQEGEDQREGGSSGGKISGQEGGGVALYGKDSWADAADSLYQHTIAATKLVKGGRERAWGYARHSAR